MTRLALFTGIRSIEELHEKQETKDQQIVVDEDYYSYKRREQQQKSDYNAAVAGKNLLSAPKTYNKSPLHAQKEHNMQRAISADSLVTS